jgi:phosphatidylinositol alpha-1,6-mannosyltransferase
MARPGIGDARLVSNAGETLKRENTRALILGLFPEISALGGIQQVSRHAGAALEELAEQRGERCELLGLNDPAGEGSFAVGGRRFAFRGFARNKAGLLFHLMRRAPGTRLLLAGHVNLGPAALWATVWHPRLKFWVVAHGMEVWEPLPLLRRTALRRATGVLGVSRHTAEAVARVQGVTPERTGVLPLALEPEFLEPDAAPAPLSVPAGSRVLLTVARLLASEPGKGVDTVIRAMPRLTSQCPNLYYVIVGDGDARPSLERLAAECGVGERVVFAGAQKTGSLRGFYEAADVFVMPSRQEGFGIVYLEAMAAGKPAVAANRGGAPEVVADSETGFLVEYGDVDALAARLARLLSDDELRRRMGETARRKVEQQHRYKQFRDRLLAFLEPADDGRR